MCTASEIPRLWWWELYTAYNRLNGTVWWEHLAKLFRGVKWLHARADGFCAPGTSTTCGLTVAGHVPGFEHELAFPMPQTLTVCASQRV